jgi:hypothetical protein
MAQANLTQIDTPLVGKPEARQESTPNTRTRDWRHRVAEAVLESGVLVTAGWFLVDVRDALWLHNPCGLRGRRTAAGSRGL